MSSIPFDVLAATVLYASLSLGMVWIAGRKRAIDERFERRRCPSCGVFRSRRSGCRCLQH